MSNRVWITWERQTRNISMARLFECQYLELISNRHKLIRYVILTYKTLKILNQLKPQEIFFQNPSIVLAAVCACYKIFNKRKKVIGDFHNAAIEPSSLSFVNRFVARHVDLTIVSNENLIPKVKAMGGVPCVVPDPIPAKHIADKLPANDVENNEQAIVFICSWASDEPISVVLDAYIESAVYARGIKLYITGRVRADRLSRSIDEYNSLGVRFLGFVDEDKYWELIEHSICNIDLTTRDDCLVCGAYESIAVGNTVILSGNQASQAYFKDYCLYTNNTVPDLKEKILSVAMAVTEHKATAKKAKEFFQKSDSMKKQTVEKFLKSGELV